MSTTQRAQCALYQLGYNAQLLIAFADDYWFAARPDSPFPHARSSVLGEIQTQSLVAADLLEPETLVRAVQQLELASECAWAHLQESWQGSRHSEVIRILEIPERVVDYDSEEWWSQATPLEQTPFRTLTTSLIQIDTELPPNFACCFAAGRLAAQVLTLPYNRCEQDQIRGERFPIAALRQRLIELRQHVDVLADFEIHLPEAFAPVAGVSQSEYSKWVVQAAHSQIVSRLSAASVTELGREDGHGGPQESPAESTGNASTLAGTVDDNQIARPRQEGRQESETTDSPPRLQEPSANAIAAYRLTFIIEGSQTELAAELQTRLGTPVSQGQVSRWLSAVRRFLEAGNVLPGFETTPARRERAMNPASLDMGARQDPRPPRPSNLSDDD